MQIARILYPIESLGPGKRLVIWTQGCTKACLNCASPEFQPYDSKKEIAVEALLNSIRYVVETGGKAPDGVTISGGEPFEQTGELLKLIQGLSKITSDILVYTGYTWEELQRKLSVEEINIVKENIAVLIDGRYKDELNDSKSSLRGSTNQKIHYFDEMVKERYEEYLNRGRSIQNVIYGEHILSVGIHNKGEK